ncbi:MAG TPA: restriction endonuclease subunit S [Candidatus Rifleibacterium sp.]|nr:restriction endonuclease subunit S [Candidatus Rifleibacterium sp.]
MKLPSTNKWEKVRLTEICSPKQWKTLSTKEMIGEGFPVYGANGIIGFHSNFNHERPTILVTCRGATCGSLNISKPFSYVNGNAMALDDLDEARVSLRFLFYFLKFTGFNSVISGSAQPQITKSNLEKIWVKFPELRLQERIVAKLDSLLARVESCRAHLDRAAAAIKRFRQSIFNLAVLHSSDSCVSKSDKILNVKGSDVFSFITSGSRGWAQYYSDKDGDIFLRITNLNFDSLDLDLESAKIQRVIPPQNAEGRRTLVNENDVLISITGDVGMIGLVPPFLHQKGYINQHIALARPNSRVVPEYLCYFLMSKKGGHRQFSLLKRGATKSGLTLIDIKNLCIPLPDLATQKQVVKRIQHLLKNVEKTEKQLESARKRIEVITASILAKAFRGELV